MRQHVVMVQRLWCCCTELPMGGAVAGPAEDLRQVNQVSFLGNACWDGLVDDGCTEAIAEHVPEVRDLVDTLRAVFVRFAEEQAVLAHVRSISDVLAAFGESKELLADVGNQELVSGIFRRFVRELTEGVPSKLVRRGHHEKVLASLRTFLDELSVTLDVVTSRSSRRHEKQCHVVATNYKGQIYFDQMDRPKLSCGQLHSLERIIEAELDAGQEVELMDAGVSIWPQEPQLA
mmetsp:Transcript_91451/g.258991  ORF Transcript_91451/g.258991 Transcript_91451/m.258991 type:complete len:233 (+) Transcript_91451:56-754(+)